MAVCGILGRVDLADKFATQGRLYPGREILLEVFQVERTKIQVQRFEAIETVRSTKLIAASIDQRDDALAIDAA